jgi:hypothetical protein
VSIHPLALPPPNPDVPQRFVVRLALGLFALLYLILLAAAPAFSQTLAAPGRRAPESELALVSSISLGHVQFFGYAEDRELYPIGFEYDRHTWGGFLHARVDYVGEILPVVLLNEPAHYGKNSFPTGPGRQLEYGADISPVGVRLLWRRDRTFKPYLSGKGGIVYFKNRVLSTEGTHLNFSAQFSGGIETRIARKIDVRVGYGIFHFSNGDIGRANPGVDFSCISLAAGYRFGNR